MSQTSIQPRATVRPWRAASPEHIGVVLAVVPCGVTVAWSWDGATTWPTVLTWIPGHVVPEEGNEAARMYARWLAPEVTT